jgi:hypothetical protein
MAAHRLLLLAVAAVLVAVDADRAGACSCADLDPRDRVEAGVPAVIGRVVSAPDRLTASPRAARYVVRVERAVNVRLGDEVVVHASPFSSSCGVDWEVGQRVGAFLDRSRGRWTTGLCSIAQPREIERALRGYPLPLGRGRVALLAGGSFGNARVMALDRRGRILGYGFGEGTARRISVCPGGRVAAELVDSGRRRTLVALRSLESLEMLSAAEVPRHMSELACADAAGATVYAGGLDYRGRPVRGRAEVHHVTGSARTRVMSRPAEQFGLAAGAAYLWSGRRVMEISLLDGSERTLLRTSLPERIAPSPFGGRLAVHGFDDRLRLIDLATGAVESRRLRPAWALAWLAPNRLLARVRGTGVILDGDLRRVRRYGFYRAVGQAHVAGGLYGTGRYRLIRLDLGSGRRRTVATLPDRGIMDLVGVPDGPEVAVPRRAPRATARSARGAVKLCRWTVTRNPPSSSISTGR